MKPQFIVEQKITAFINRYEVYGVSDEGSKAGMIAFAEQKRLAFKEKVSFYTDASKQKLAFTFRAEKVMDVHGKFYVEDAKGNKIGAFKKEFKKSLLNSTWVVLDTKGNVSLTISESNKILAVVRRAVGWIPIIGEIMEALTSFIKYHFSFRDSNKDEVGRYRKTTLFRDHYQLSMNSKDYSLQDWRILASIAVALDALQSR